jgi:hypothetical protein
MTTATAQKASLPWAILALFAAFLGLCTIFVSVATAAQAWSEHSQAQWPTVPARVDACRLQQASTGRRNRYYILCRLNYVIGAEEHAANIYSLSVPSAEVWQYPPNQIGPLQQWLDSHTPGTSIVLHFNPANHKKVVLLETDMPYGGPRTPKNVKLLEVTAGIFLLLLAIARVTRPRSLQHVAAP